MKHKKLKALLITGVLTLGLCAGCGHDKEMNTLQEKHGNSQKLVEQHEQDKEKLIEENKTSKQQTNKKNDSQDKTVKQEKATKKTKTNSTNKNKETVKDKTDNNASTGQDCSVCGKFVPMSDMCDCNGKIHHRGCKHKVYNCPRCGHSTTANPNSPNFGCGWCGYPDEDIRINYCHICGKVVTGNNQYGECSDLCQSCGENINNSTTEDYNNNNSSFDGASNDVTTNQPSKGYVYWTPSGKSYHSRKSCPTLKRSKVIYEGYNCPKTDPCNICY